MREKQLMIHILTTDALFFKKTSAFLSTKTELAFSTIMATKWKKALGKN